VTSARWHYDRLCHPDCWTVWTGPLCLCHSLSWWSQHCPLGRSVTRGFNQCSYVKRVYCGASWCRQKEWHTSVSGLVWIEGALMNIVRLFSLSSCHCFLCWCQLLLQSDWVWIWCDKPDLLWLNPLVWIKRILIVIMAVFLLLITTRCGLHE